MSVFRRSPQLSPGVYDEIVTASLDARLATLAESHEIDRRAVTHESDVDELLVSLIRDAARVAIGSRSKAEDKVAVAQRLLADEKAFREALASASHRRASLEFVVHLRQLPSAPPETPKAARRSASITPTSLMAHFVGRGLERIS